MKKHSNVKILVSIIGVIVAIYLASLAKVIIKDMMNTDNKQPNVEINEIAESINKQFGVPTMIDDETQLTAVSAANGRISFNYILINYTYEQLLERNFDVSEIETEVKSQICNRKDYAKLLRRGIGFEYVYSGKNGNRYGIFVVEPSYCDN